jgi:hypothetical protein
MFGEEHAVQPDARGVLDHLFGRQRTVATTSIGVDVQVKD